MYIPDDFRLEDPEAIRAAIAKNPFASFATNGPDGPEVSHLPLIAMDESDGLVLYGHFARANPHWKSLDGKTPALAVFSGPQGYISPNWYATKRETGKVVPTWNYVIVHARGIPKILDHGPESRKALEILTDAMEQPRAEPWRVEDAPEQYTEGMMRGIVAFRMPVTMLEAKAKLSQNRPAADIDGASQGLTSEGMIELAEAMREGKP